MTHLPIWTCWSFLREDQIEETSFLRLPIKEKVPQMGLMWEFQEIFQPWYCQYGGPTAGTSADCTSSSSSFDHSILSVFATTHETQVKLKSNSIPEILAKTRLLFWRECHQLFLLCHSCPQHQV